MMTKESIELADGSKFTFGWNDERAPSIEVIAHALSQLCRFTGHSAYVGGEIYSVAQHCVKVSWLVPERYALDGLLHDAHEVLIGDVSTPLKWHLARLGVAYGDVDREAARIVRLAYSRSAVLPPEVKRADSLMCLIEAMDLMPAQARNWGAPFEELRGEANELRFSRPSLRPAAWSPPYAKALFLQRFHELTEGR